jgi:hypothetical protein
VPGNGQLSLFPNPGRSELAAALRVCDPDLLSPRQALELIYKLKKLTAEDTGD